MSRVNFPAASLVELPARRRSAVRQCAVLKTAAALAAACLLLSGCGGSKDKSSTQVAAKVNKEEISVHQINFMLQRTPGITAETADAASRQILDRLISQELAVQKAQELKLDRNPATVQALEAARREVLARAFIDSLGERVAKPTPEEVAAFYTAKPALFKERKIYTFQEISIAGTPQQLKDIQTKLTAAGSSQELANYLKASGLKYGAKLVTQPAENLPLELLDRFAGLGNGQVLYVPQPGGAKAFVLVAAVPGPVDQATAAPAIEKFLLNDRRRIRTEADMKALRDGAQVQLMGKFAEPPASAPAPAAAPPAQAPASAPGLTDEEIKKGLGVLK